MSLVSKTLSMVPDMKEGITAHELTVRSELVKIALFV